MKTNKYVIAILLTVCFSSISMAYCQNPPTTAQKDSVKRSLLLSIGVGASNNILISGAEDSDLQSGKFGVLLEGKIGFPIKPDLYIHTEGFGIFSSFKHNSQINGKGDIVSVGVTTKQSFYGLGATYFFTPFSYYIAGSLGISSYKYKSSVPDEFIVSGNGFGMRGKVGKDWRIANKMALGLNVSYDISFIKTSSALDIAFSRSETIDIHNVLLSLSFSYY